MHVFPDFTFDILELLFQISLFSRRQVLLRQWEQQEILLPDVRWVQLDELLEQIDNTVPHRCGIVEGLPSPSQHKLRDLPMD